MARKGHKPIPFTLLKFKGTARKDRHGDGHEVETPAQLATKPQRYRFPKPPKNDGEQVLGKVGLAEWRNVKRHMEATGVIQPMHHAVLFGYCALYEMSVTKPQSMTAALWTQLRVFAAEMGFTPSAAERNRRPAD